MAAGSWAERSGAERSRGGLRPYAALAGLALVWCGSTPAAAQSRSPGAAAVLACRTLADPAQQLACFRKASDTLAAEQPTKAQQSAAIGPETAAPAPEKRPFGAPKPRPVRTARAKPKAKVDGEDSLTVKVLSFADRGDGRVIFTFDDGSTWVQTQSDESIAGSLRVGDTVTLRRGLLSGFILDIPGRSFIRVARVGGG